MRKAPLRRQLKPVLGKLHTLKPNRIEAELLSGVKITDDASLQKAAETLLDTGLHRVFISLGSDGVFAADRSGQQVHSLCGHIRRPDRSAGIDCGTRCPSDRSDRPLNGFYRPVGGFY